MLKQKAKVVFFIISAIAFVAVNTLPALADVSYQTLFTPFYDPNASESCLGGPAGTGPLYGPRFPKISDTADLASRIKTYIKNTNPSSPLTTYSGNIVSIGQKYDVNPAFVVSLAQKETSLGTAGNGPAPKYNIFNVRNGAAGSFGNYPSVQSSVEEVNKLLSSGTYMGGPSNFTTIKQIMYKYAPPSENDTVSYLEFISSVMHKVLEGVQATGDTQTTSSDSCAPDSSVSGSVNADGYSFPVSPQTKSSNGGVPGMSGLPCSQVSCHHDGTAAFDISRKPGGDSIVGTPVYAISDGKVDMVHLYTYNGEVIQGCYSLQLHSSKDNFWYWYGHIQSPAVTSGQSVQAGQKVAVIGERKCTGNGSDSHLHIDRGCIIDGVPQKGGTEDCRDPGINELINKLWSELPN